MATRIEDYTEQGKAGNEGKFILLVAGEERVYAFAPYELCEYHGDIAERFLRERGIGGHKGRNEAFLPDGGPWSIPGGARWRLAGGVLHLHGRSYGYGPLELDEVATELRPLQPLGCERVVA